MDYYLALRFGYSFFLFLTSPKISWTNLNVSLLVNVAMVLPLYILYFNVSLPMSSKITAPKFLHSTAVSKCMPQNLNYLYKLCDVFSTENSKVFR